MTKSAILITCAVSLICGGLYLHGQSKPNTNAPAISKLANDAFSIGAFYGYAVCQNGGTPEDLAYIIGCQSSNRVDLAAKWFNEHPFKPNQHTERTK